MNKKALMEYELSKENFVCHATYLMPRSHGRTKKITKEMLNSFIQYLSARDSKNAYPKKTSGLEWDHCFVGIFSVFYSGQKFVLQLKTWGIRVESAKLIQNHVCSYILSVRVLKAMFELILSEVAETKMSNQSNTIKIVVVIKNFNCN